MHDDASINVPRWFAMSPFLGPGDSPPPSVDVEVSFGAQSQRSRSRSINDNHYVIVRLGRHQETLMTSLPDGEIPNRFDESGYAMALADGMGPAGEAASRLGISTLVHLALYFGKWNVRIDEPIAEEVMDRAERFYRSIDSTLLQAGAERAPGLQTALTTIFSAGYELFFVHVGPSRAYMFRDDHLMCLTRHDSAKRAVTTAGVVVDMATRDRAPRAIITEALGGSRGGAARIAVERCGLLDGDVVLLCNHALADRLDDAQLADALRQHRDPDSQCRALVDLAVKAGVDDDATALVAHYRIAT